MPSFSVAIAFKSLLFVLSGKLKTDWQAWMDEIAKLTAEIMARREGQPLDVDALWQAARADLETRDEHILGH